ncbi:MAG: hypothetical protein R3B45_01695 [Bdellovibrionota bacterium]
MLNPINIRQLNEQFYRYYDPALHRTLHQMYTSEGHLRNHQYLGGGRHFKVWRISRTQEYAQVISVSNSGFIQDRGGEAGIIKWSALMHKLKLLDHPLVPPFEISLLSEEASIMMPFGCDRIPNALKTPGLIDSSIESLKVELTKALLTIDDVLQIRYANSTPFICDFSDLYPLKLPD